MDPEPSSLIITLISVNLPLISGIILLVVLLTCSALISGAEVAFFSLTRSDIDTGLDEKPNTFNIISNLLERPKKLLATILVANNFINIGIVILFAYLGESLFHSIQVPWVRFLLEVVVITFLILLFGEILPKIYASRNRVKFSSFMAVPLRFLDVVFTPVSMPMRFITITIQNRLGKQKSNISVDQLSQALELTSEQDTTTEEHKILQGIVSFGNTDTKQVMRPRMDIFALNSEQKYSEIIPEIVKNGYSRIPVYKESIDTVVGILYVKDLLPYIDRKQFDWTSLLREPFFVPENKKLDDLMVEFQTKKVHLAVVVDEYGGTSGLVSLEDVIEEIVGDISDEFDDEDLIYTIIDDKNFLFEGKTPLKDFYRIISLEDDSDFEEFKGEAETVAGFVLEISGIFPRVRSKINFKNYVFTIEALDKKRIKQVKFTILD
ncbi:MULTISPECIES: gliding motility-associated protein GldE [Flavobacteriaceae]|uniref:Protein involved in gliding motility GldE n=1 Tax=Meridianimaribacter flavus TaxID=571115 RepID=A0ABY2G8T5_9FLAO|nr:MULTISPECIES: gliding motility-associated protein GldE [Meridianimaribacter]RYH76006.1 gliding motility-associated protein GldE [Flavobacteriaceae bacterium 144Ye]TBV28097.1 gliding motility-associated protein GldE [Meridianimaribacter sp. CL38]TDY13782.1 protein involved in gliding motility GldE [Meridianimaribacter flavus]